MRPRQITGWLTRLAAVALLLACGPARAPAAVCVMVTPGIDLGCRDEQGAPAGGEPTASSEPAGAPTEPEPVTRNSTMVRYDPRRVAVTFKRGVTRARIRSVISAAGGMLETAIPQIRAYLVGVEPEHRAEVLATLQSSSAVANAAKEPIAEAFDTSPDDTDWPQQAASALRASRRRGT
jgi:hypothetical protein